MTINPSFVSVLMPAYNHEGYVTEAIESVFNQNYKNFELIVINDGSTDNTLETIKNLQNKYDFKLINQTNMGICKTLNVGIRESKGKYISLLASDDRYRPDFLKTAVELLDKSGEDVGMIYSDALLINSEGKPRYGLFIQRARDFSQLPEGDLFPLLMDGNFIPAMTVMMKRSVLDDVGFFDEELKHEDYDMWLRITSKYKVVLNSYLSAEYRLHEANSHVTLQHKRLNDTLKIYYKHLTNEKYSNKVLKRLRTEIEHLYILHQKSLVDFIDNEREEIYRIFPQIGFYKISLPKVVKKIIMRVCRVKKIA